MRLSNVYRSLFFAKNWIYKINIMYSLKLFKELNSGCLEGSNWTGVCIFFLYSINLQKHPQTIDRCMLKCFVLCYIFWGHFHSNNFQTKLSICMVIKWYQYLKCLTLQQRCVSSLCRDSYLYIPACFNAWKHIVE